jgi:hypothetical protein
LKDNKDMKTKCMYALFVLLLFFSFNIAVAGRERVERESIKTEYSENRFVDRFSDFTLTTNLTPEPFGAEDEGGITPPGGGGGRPGPGDALNPIGDAVWLVLLFGLVYGVSLYKRRRIVSIR